MVNNFNLLMWHLPNSGKIGYFDILHFLLNSTYVIPRPKTIPGIAQGSSEDVDYTVNVDLLDENYNKQDSGSKTLRVNYWDPFGLG